MRARRQILSRQEQIAKERFKKMRDNLASSRRRTLRNRFYDDVARILAGVDDKLPTRGRRSHYDLDGFAKKKPKVRRSVNNHTAPVDHDTAASLAGVNAPER